MKRHYAYYVPLVLLFLIAVVYQTRYTQGRLQYLFSTTERVRSPIDTEYVGPTISVVSDEAAAAGVHKGDQITSVDGVPYTGDGVLLDRLHDSKPGDVITLGIQHKTGEPLADEERRVTLRASVGASIPTIWDVWFIFVLSIATPLVCLLLGFFVAAMRPRDPLAWLLLFLLLGFGQLILGVDQLAWRSGARTVMVAYQTFFKSAWALWMLLFGIYFPERWIVDRRWPWAKWILIIPSAIFILKDTVVAVGNLVNFATVAPLYSAFAPYGFLSTVTTMAGTGIFFTALGHKKGIASTPDARRRLRLLLYGAQISLTPALVIFIVGLVTGKPTNEAAPVWVTLPALFLFLLFPLTFAYVIVVHRAMDVRMVVRQGVQYALARGGARVLQMMLVASIIGTSLLLAESPRTNRAQKMIVIGVGVLFIFLIRRGAERLRGWTDRRFFREAYDSEQILSDLSDNVRSMVETGPLLQTVAERISESLHVPRVAFLLKNKDVYSPAHVLGYETPPEVSFGEKDATIERLRKHNEPILIYNDDPDSWLYATPGLEDQLHKLRTLDTQMLLPLNVKEKLPGFISLSPKQSEEPYSSTDMRLLQSVAVQTGLALENSQLTAAIASEVAQRERLNREVEIAREVQQRLFPQELPPIEGLDYFGACRPALGVGGDYYDFILLPNSSFGIAIGDVSGKGISAALLMASLQASLRGQTIGGSNDLASMMRNVNRLVYDASSANMYATFFYAQYEPQSRKLSYVNAGHNPPMVFRNSNGKPEILRLAEGGCVVGLLPEYPYSQASVTLQPGDIFVGFTDGISEAMNDDEEEWGEERMTEFIYTCDGNCAETLVADVVRGADAFAAGAKQHDDMTIIVVRLKGES